MEKIECKEEPLNLRAFHCARMHNAAWESWPHGNVEKYWEDGDGVLCIQYADGAWWHYKETNEGVEWW